MDDFEYFGDGGDHFQPPEECIFQDEVGAYNRSSGSMMNISRTTKGESCEGKFKTLVMLKIDMLKQRGIVINIENIFSSNLRYPEYKNPLAYVLGYYVLEAKEIDMAKFKKVTRFLKDSDDTVMPEDVIRYATLWKKTLMK